MTSSPVNSGGSFSAKRHIWVTVIVMAIWLALVIYTTSQHEVFRDEVRAWSLAKTASTPLDLYEVSKYDGHPVLWFFLLYVGTIFTNSPIILPIISIMVAMAAVVIFLHYSPFPLWFRILFIFSGLPVYEYSVVARNYGISMLLLFLVTYFYSKRKKHPLLLATLLALLANTNIFALIISGLISGLWLWSFWTEKQRGGKPVSGGYLISLILILIFGLTMSLFFIAPRENSNLVSEGLPMNFQNLVYATVQSILRPDISFNLFFPQWIPPFFRILMLYMVVIGLIGRPKLMVAAFATQVVIGVFFRMFVVGSYRHQGIYFMILIALYWMLLAEPERISRDRLRRNLMYGGMYFALTFLILGNIARAKFLVLSDIRYEFSSGKALGAFLNNDPALHKATLVAEPDFHMETLPYYADNPIYFPREHRFGTTVSWNYSSDSVLTLGGLMNSAREIRERENGLVLIIVGDPVRLGAPGEDILYPFQRRFSWTREEYIDFDTSTILLRDFDKAYAYQENYRVYMLK